MVPWMAYASWSFKHTRCRCEGFYLYEYPDADEVESLGLKGIYLDNYFKWDGITNAKISQTLGFETAPSPIRGTIANYENLDNYVHGIHDYQKYLKFGFSRSTDVACNLIRRGLLTRQDAIALVSMNDGLYPSEYLGKSLTTILSDFDITLSEFEQSCDDFTNYDLFETDQNGDLIKRPDGSPRLRFNYT